MRTLLLILVLLGLTAASAASLSGRVASLSGEPEKGVTVHAIAESGAEVEAVTDGQGAYVLTVDQGKYKVGVKVNDGDARIARATPEAAAVSVAGDMKDINFIAFRRASKYDLSGTIRGLSTSTQQHLSTLTIELALASAPNTVVAKTQTLAKTSPYFSFHNLPSETYILSIRTSLPSRTYSFTSPSLTITLTSSIHVTPVVDIGFKLSTVQEMQSNAGLNSVLLLIALFALMKKEAATTVVKGVWKTIQTRNPAHVKNAVLALTSGGSGVTGAASFERSAAEAQTATTSSKKPKYPAKKEKTHVSTFVRYDSLPVEQRPQPVVAESPSPLPTPEPKPARLAEPKIEAPKKRAHTPAPPAVPSPVATPEPKEAPVKVEAKKPSPKPTPVAAPEKVKPTPKPAVVAAAATYVAPTPIVAAAPAVSGAKFCAECGNKRPDMAAKFCSECGAKY